MEWFGFFLYFSLKIMVVFLIFLMDFRCVIGGWDLDVKMGFLGFLAIQFVRVEIEIIWNAAVPISFL